MRVTDVIKTGQNIDVHGITREKVLKVQLQDLVLKENNTNHGKVLEY